MGKNQERAAIVFMTGAGVFLLLAQGAGAAQNVEAGCTGVFVSPAEGRCETHFEVPHFDGQDQVASFEAALTSVMSIDWRVEGNVWDATGTHYLSWSCKAEASVPLVTSVSHGCSLHRPAFVNAQGENYKADAAGPQRLAVTATAEHCAEAAILGCPFEARITLQLHD